MSPLTRFKLKASCLGLALCVAGQAQASPWTLPQGRLLISNGYDFQLATSEFINEGAERSFPLRGRYTGASFSLAARLGITDRFEVEARLPLQLVSFSSDSVILLDPPDPGSPQANAFYRNNVINLSNSNFGIGDVTFAGRYGITRRPIALAVEVKLKAPSGYEGPAGTFGAEPTTREGLLNDLGAVVRPDRVQDDVTLGDGQLDISASVLMGAAFSTGTFMRLGAGYKLRLSGAGDQILADLKVGQRIVSSLLVYAGGSIAYSIQQGRSVGITVAAVDPELPANQYGGLNNLLLIERRLQSDVVQINAGVIYRVGKALELNVAYGRAVWGRFVAATNTLSLSLVFRTNIYGDG